MKERGTLITDQGHIDIEFEMTEEKRGRITSDIPTTFYQGDPSGITATIEVEDRKRDVLMITNKEFTLTK